jgi:hypothetical protein
MRGNSVPGEHRWRRYRGTRRMLSGAHIRQPGLWDNLRIFAAAFAAGLVVFGAAGFYLISHAPNGQLFPASPPGIDRPVAGISETAVERLQQGDDPPAASRSQPRTGLVPPSSPAPVLSREPDRPRPPDGASPTPQAAATPPPDGGTAAQGPMPTTPCPPPLPPPRPKKSKKAAAAEVSAGPDGVTKKLFILKPERTGPAG